MSSPRTVAVEKGTKAVICVNFSACGKRKFNNLRANFVRKIPRKEFFNTHFRKHPISYYWSTYQHEWALDVVFHHAAYLRRFYPRWVNHAMTTFSSPDVMRFLGKHLTLSGQISQK